MQSNFAIGKNLEEWAKKSNLAHLYLPETNSTNDLAKEYNWTEEEFFIFCTDYQSKGRGRSQNLWISPEPGTALLSTWCFKLNQAPQAITSALVGLACYRALNQTFANCDFSIKPPNDIYWESAKLAGILIEAQQMGDQYRLFIGIGINVFSKPSIQNSDKQAACLQDFISQIKPAKMHELFDLLLVNLTEAIGKTYDPNITSSDLFELEQAIQKNKSLGQEKIKIKNDGSLIYPDKTIHWSNL